MKLHHYLQGNRIKRRRKKRKRKKKSLEKVISDPEHVLGICIICIDSESTIMIKPCNHVCACSRCSKKIKKKCPICRGIVEGKERVYVC